MWQQPKLLSCGDGYRIRRSCNNGLQDAFDLGIWEPNMSSLLAFVLKLGKRAATMIAALLATAQFAQGQAVLTANEARAVAIYAPRPQYPYEARSKGITGSGVFMLNIDPKHGLVRSVTVVQSTGSPILDNAARAAFKQWRFKPGTGSKARVPQAF